RFFEHARTAPAATALIAPDGTETGYGALADRALRVAGAVAAAAAPGETVAVHLPKGADQVAAVLSVLAAGCAYLPVGRDHPPARRWAGLVAGQPAVQAAAGPVAAELTSGPVLRPALLRTAPPGRPRRGPADALAYVLFPSGSTGAPKGVEIERRAAAHTVDVL